MSLSNLIILSIPTFILALALFFKNKNSNRLKTQLENLQKNQAYQENLIKDVQASIQYGDNLGEIVDTITNRFANDFEFSTLCSIFVKGSKLIFSSQIKEGINNAFIEHIKNDMLSTLSKEHRELTENISGVPLNNLSTSTIMSSCSFVISLKKDVVAVINLSSTQPNLYKEGVFKSLTSAFEIISGMLSKIESELGIEKSKTLSMIDSFSEGIFMIDNSQNLVAINNAALKFLNIHKSVPVINDVLIALPITYNFKGRIGQVIAEKKQLIEEALALNDKTFRIIITPVLKLNDEENVIGVTFLMQDTTVEKSLNQMKQDFTNIMVHELRSPLTAIRASSEFLSSQADLTPDEKHRMVDMISTASKKMLDKISLILDSAKMDAGLFSIKKTPCDLKKLINDRINVFTQMAVEKTIAISVDIDPAITSFSFDPIRIDEVLNNLLSNSLKFTPTGGSIKLKAIKDTNNITVSVSDTGAGIPKDKQSKLFSKFQQAPTDGQHVGTGLGLYVVKGVVEAHGGSIQLESEEGHGTTISFTLPVTEAAQAPAPSIKSPAAPPSTMSN